MTTRILPVFLVMLASSIAWNQAGGACPKDGDTVRRPAIVLVAFGTSDPEARKVFDHIDAAAKRRYPNHDIRWAFTSEFIRKKLTQQGVSTKGLDEVVKDLKRDGHTSAVFQSLHVAPGQEYQEIQEVDTSSLRVAVGSALLTDDGDMAAVIAALGEEIKADAPNVMVCHGNRRHPEFNRQLLAFAEKIEAQYQNIVVCSVEGQPGTDKLAEARREAAQSGSVHFIPLMVVAGVHIAEDILSDAADSWKSVVGAKETTCAKPLGYNDKVLAVYFGHLDEALAKLKKGGTEDGSVSAEPQKTRSRSKRKASAYTSWKRHLPFWPRKAYLLAELSVFITLGVLFAQVLEVSGTVKVFAILAWPIIKLGRLGDAASAPLLMSVQSGAVANGMLVSSRDRGDLNNRQLYTAVLTVSCLSLFAHLPTYVVPIGSVLGAEATFALFAVRFAAIFFEIIVILLVSNCVVCRFTDSRVAGLEPGDTNDEDGNTEPNQVQPKRRGKQKKGFLATVWSRSYRTLRRLLIYLIPTYVLMAMLEYYGAFKALTEAVPGLCSFSFLPPQSAIIIPAQAMSLYAGAIAAAAYIDTGEITAKQAVLTILVGSLVTAPIRTLKHAMPTYVAILGPKAGPLMAISAQVLRSIFLIICAVVMWFAWI